MFPKQELRGHSPDLPRATGRQAELNRLAENEERFRLEAQAAGFGTYETDYLAGKILCSPELRQLLRLPSAERAHLLDDGCPSWVHPEDRPRLAQALSQAYDPAGSGEYELEYRVLRPGGEAGWVLDRGKVAFEGQGALRHPAMGHGLLLDISRRKEIELQLKEKDEFLIAALTASDAGTFRWNILSGDIYFDEALNTLWGADSAQPITTLEQVIERIHPDDREAFLAAIERTTVEGAPFDLEYRILRPDGSIRWIVDKGRVFFDADGKPSYMCGACIDGTKHKLTEALLEQRSNELKQHVQELHCLFALSRLIEREDDLDRLFEQVVQIIPPAFSLSCPVGARIVRAGKTFCSGDRIPDRPEVSEDILVQGEAFAQLHVVGLADVQFAAADSEQRMLIRQIARKLGRAVERKLALDALRESEDRWRAMSSALKEGVVLHGKDGEFLTWNPSAERLLELSASELEHRSSTNSTWYVIREDGTEFPGEEHPSMVTLRTGQPCYNVVMGLQRPGKPLRWISINSQPLFHHGGPKPSGVVVSFDDITDRKLIEEERRLLAIIAATSPDAIISINLKGCITSWNKGAEELYGYSADEVMGQNVAFILPDDRTQELGRALSAWQRGDPIPNYETQRRRKDGELIHVSVSVSPIFDANGNIQGGAAITRDITERKRNEERTALLAALVATSPDAIVSCDLQGRITTWNQGAEQMYGYRVEEALGQSVRMLMPEDRLTEMDKVLAKIRSGQRVSYYDTVRKRKDGKLVAISIAISPILDVQGGITGAAAVARDISQRKQMEEQLQHNAFHDRLTGVPNRSLFMDRLNHVVARAERFSENYAVFVMDMDNFKLINDSFGHLVGDQLLCAFAERIQRLLRPVDTLARFGGDEFTLLLEETENLDAVEQVAERIIAALRPPFRLNGQELIVSSSIGITLGDACYQSADQALRDADVALYEAKRQGKNQYVIFDSRMRGEAVSRLYLESELRRALLETELSVNYQPIVDLQTDQIVGCEALARWNHPTMGVVEPSRFINVAEETGLITPLGRFVLERSAQALAQWLQQPNTADDFYISVNISPKEFYARDLVAFVQQVLQKYGLRGANVRLEITETVVIQHDREATAILVALQGMGVQVCLDDFGTGYSSLSYLHQLPFDVIKVDRSFVQLLAEKHQSREIVRSVLGLANALDMQSIAEGAETPEQLEQVKALGFRWAQGYVLHRPMGRQALARLLAGDVQPER